MSHRSIFVSAIFLSIAVAISISAPALTSETLSRAQERALKPKDIFKECGRCPEMIVVSSGSFTMGSPDDEWTNDWDRARDEGPQHVVTFARPFAVGEFEVSVSQLAAFIEESRYDAGSQCSTFELGKFELRSGRSFRNPGYEQTGAHPAACISWNDAMAYVGWLSRKTGKTYRLLTEAEWEYVARAGTTARYVAGDDEVALCQHANGADQTLIAELVKIRSLHAENQMPRLWCSDSYAYTAPVGSFSPNAFGLYDVLGNVAEWVEDCYHDSYAEAPSDGSAWASGDCKYRVSRGGAWYDYARDLRAASRAWITNDRSYGRGFRIARTLTP